MTIMAVCNRWVTETAERTLERIDRFDDGANEYARVNYHGLLALTRSLRTGLACVFSAWDSCQRKTLVAHSQTPEAI